MSDYISKENTLKNIGLLNASVLMGNNKEVDNVIGGYNPTSFIVGMSYGLEQAQAMISSQQTLDEKEIIRKYGEQILDAFYGKHAEYRRLSEQANIELPQECYYSGHTKGFEEAIKIVKEECGISE